MSAFKHSGGFGLLALVVLVAFVGGGLGQKASTVSSSKPTKGSSLIVITEDDWDQTLHGEWMVEFHAPWCPACRQLQPEWKTFSSWGSDLGIKIGAVDVTTNPGLSGRFMVTALPTIYHVKDGVFRQYKGSRDSNSFVSFVEEKKWQTSEPVSSWKSPSSVIMSMVSYFFKISMALRSVHNSLVEDYGIPYWGSYVLFGFTTILVGAILGLIIVCVIDVIFPAKMTDESYRESKKNDWSAKKDDDDIVDEDEEETEPEEAEKDSGEESSAKSTASEDENKDTKPTARKRRTRREQ